MQLSGKTYDLAKWFVTIVLPAFGALYAGLADWWELPKPLEVVGTCSLVAVFLGAILGISSANYQRKNEANAGYLTQTGTDPDTGLPNLALTVTKDPSDLVAKDTVTLKVGPPPTPAA